MENYKTDIMFVIAGKYREFEDWCRNSKINPYSSSVCYVGENSIYKMEGTINPKVIYIGTFWKRLDIQEIEEFVISRKR